MRALDRAYAELDRHRRGMAEDVLDQYVHKSAVQAQAGTSCIEEVRKLVRAGDAARAQQKLEQCRQQQQRASSSLEGSLAGMRGDKFSDEQKKLDEVMNELSDVARDQDDIASESNRIFESYAEKADEVARDHRREAAKKAGTLIEKLRRRLRDINEAGLTPFAKEELDIVERRLADVERMVGDGDLAEALGMAHQAKQSLDTIAGELEAAINDDPKSKWADATQDALDGVQRARPVAKELIDELAALSPRPDQIMSADDHRALDRLRRREAMTRDPRQAARRARQAARRRAARRRRLRARQEARRRDRPDGVRRGAPARQGSVGRARRDPRRRRRARQGARPRAQRRAPGPGGRGG